MTAHAYQNPDNLDTGQISPTTSNVVPLRPDQQPADTKRPRKAPARKYLWSDAARRDENLSDNAKVVAGYLGGMFDADEEAAFATHATIARETGRSIDKVKRAIRELEAKDYLRREIGAGSIGQNKYWPRWAKLSEVPLEVCKDALPRGADLQGGECKDAREGDADLPPIIQPIIQAEHKPEDKSEDKQERNEGYATAAPPDRVRVSDDWEPAGKRRTFIPRDELAEAYQQITGAFLGNSAPIAGSTYHDHRGAVAGVLMQGFTVEQIVARMKPHNDRLLTMPEGKLHLLTFIKNEFGITTRDRSNEAPRAVDRSWDRDEYDDGEERRQDRENDRAEPKAKTSWADWPLDDDVPF